MKTIECLEEVILIFVVVKAVKWGGGGGRGRVRALVEISYFYCSTY